MVGEVEEGRRREMLFVVLGGLFRGVVLVVRLCGIRDILDDWFTC